MLRGPSLALALTLGAGCGGPAATSPAVPPRVTPTTPPSPAGIAPARTLDRADCGKLLDHYLGLQVGELRTRLLPDQVPTDAQLGEIRRRFETEGMDGCVGAPRPPFDCAMAATSVETLERCLAAGRATGVGDGP